MPDDELYVVTVNESASILCPAHTKAYVEIMTSMDLPCQVIELTDEDYLKFNCMACDLQEQLDKPQIILPN
jgi:hypothetical protein